MAVFIFRGLFFVQSVLSRRLLKIHTANCVGQGASSQLVCMWYWIAWSFLYYGFGLVPLLIYALPQNDPIRE